MLKKELEKAESQVDELFTKAAKSSKTVYLLLGGVALVVLAWLLG